MLLVDYVQMLNMAPAALPVEIYPDSIVHFQPVHHPITQHSTGLLMVQVRQTHHSTKRN